MFSRGKIHTRKCTHKVADEQELIILIRAHGDTKDRCTALACENYLNHYNTSPWRFVVQHDSK